MRNLHLSLRNIPMLLALFVMGLVFSSNVAAENGKPNILIIWGDDIGIFNISAYNDGIVG